MAVKDPARGEVPALPLPAAANPCDCSRFRVHGVCSVSGAGCYCLGIEGATVIVRHPLMALAFVTCLLERARGTSGTAPANRCYGDFSA
jgi:hypothetical protein